MKTKELLDHRNMMIAVKKGVVPREEFRQALQEQRRLYAKNKSHTPLSEILLERGVLTESKIEALLTPIMGRSAVSTQKDVLSPLPEATVGADEKSCKERVAAPLQKGVTLIVTKDGQAAYLCACGNESDFPTLEEAHHLLKGRGITFGVINDQEIQRELEEAAKEKISFLIATGLPAEAGEADKVTYHFDTNPFRVGTINEEGLMDWKDRGEYPHVEKDAVLATITPGKKGVPGKDIFGHTLAAEEAPRLSLFAGKGVGKSTDRLQMIAKVSGQPQLAGKGNILVIQTLDVKGDIGIETGHVDFEGHIEVRGAIEKGYQVKGNSLRAKEILSDAVEIIGDVVAIRGIFGANIRCGGRVKANHVNKSTIIAEGDIVVSKEVVDCKLITNGKLILDGGTILSSEIYAKKGLNAGTVGSEVAFPSKLIVGVDRISEINIEKLNKEISENTEKIAALEKEIPLLNEESDRLSTELGNIAQIQDRYMVGRRKITELLDKEKRGSTPEEQAIISDFDTKIAEIDKTVEALMAMDEKAKTQVLSYRNEIFGLDERSKALSEQIKDTELFAKRDMGIPVIQVTGKLYQNTRIEGPHDSIVIQKTISNANLKEQKNTEKDAEKTYSFKSSNR